MEALCFGYRDGFSMQDCYSRPADAVLKLEHTLTTRNNALATVQIESPVPNDERIILADRE